LSTLQNLFTLAFVVTSMLSMGLSLTVSEIFQPLRNTRIVIMALVANFVLVPALAFALSRIIPLEEDVQIGLLLVGTAAGAPFLPKIAQIARASVAFAVGLMTMLIRLRFPRISLLGSSVNRGQDPRRYQGAVTQ
jgi:predicted Na+-dependent transporter